jgi:beta-galactosidase GanA
MNRRCVWLFLALYLFLDVNGFTNRLGLAQAADSAPRLKTDTGITRLVVDGQPFLMLAGELHNSSSSSLDYMKPIWPKLADLNLNTVLTPLSWELIEPEEGKYDFSLVDGLLAQARESHQRIVFLWLASWKNGMSSYPPVWVKRDTKRFPRVVIDGNEANILSTFGRITQEADARAFAALMAHIKQVDSQHTVLMVQVENEVGVLGATRDHSEAAEKAFAASVPVELTRYLHDHRDSLNPELLALWEQNGAKTSGTWEEIFGASSRTDEIFMAWNYAKYVHAVAAAGKAAYPIPMYVNTWLGGGDTKPGDYPSGGPQPRVVDVWRAAGSPTKSSIDIYCPDLYASDFAGWTARYHRAGNPLFIPETNGGPAGASGAFYAIGEHQALGISPFGIDGYLPGGWAAKSDPDNELSDAYKTLAALAPLLLSTNSPNMMHGFQLDKDHPSVEFEMNGYTLEVSLDQIFGHGAERGFGLIVATGPDTFIGAGKGFRVGFHRRAPGASKVGIAAIDEGEYQNGQFVPGRRLNGDENDQGQYWRVDQRSIHIERAMLYSFE